MSDDKLIEAMCAAHWDVNGNPKWAAIPVDWKPLCREQMRAALAVREAALNVMGDWSLGKYETPGTDGH